jgi:hypothetical protein
MYLADRMNEHDFVNAFRNSELRKEQFSYEALRALFEWYDEYAAECEQPIEFDMIGICCDWSEYTLKELKEDFLDSYVYPKGMELGAEDIEAMINCICVPVFLRNRTEPTSYLIHNPGAYSV